MQMRIPHEYLMYLIWLPHGLLSVACVSAMTRRGLIVSVVSSPTFRNIVSRFVVDVTLDSGVAHASIRCAATPCIPCQRGLSTVEFHEGHLAEERTAAPSHQAWLRYLGWP